MKLFTKLLSFLILINLFKSSYCEIYNISKLKKNDSVVAILWDCHEESKDEQQNKVQYNILTNFFKTITKPTAYILEAPNIFSIAILKDSNLIERILGKILIDRLENIKLTPADLRELSKIPDYILDMQLASSSDLKLLYEQTLKCTEYTRNKITELYQRISQLLDENYKKIMSHLLNSFLNQINQLIKSMNEFEEFNKRATTNQEYINQLNDFLVVKFADIGFILSILEHLQKGYKQIFVHVGGIHAKNIVQFLKDVLEFEKLYTHSDQDNEGLFPLSKTTLFKCYLDKIFELTINSSNDKYQEKFKKIDLSDCIFPTNINIQHDLEIAAKKFFININSCLKTIQFLKRCKMI